MSGTTFFAVSDETQLNAALLAIDAASVTAPAATAYTIDVINDITLNADIAAINLAGGDSLYSTGDAPAYGNNLATIDGNGSFRGFVALAGSVHLDSLIISDTQAKGGSGGNGPAPGGGGAGLGGAVFVGPAAAVTLSNDTLSASATGGNGGRTATTGTGAGGTGDPGGFGSGGAGGTAGSFGGGGGSGASGGFGAGSIAGGGLAAGGAIFVAQGGSLTFTSGSASPGRLNAGSPGGHAYGSGIFIQGNNTITIGSATITGVIADQTGSGGTAANAGAGSVLINGAATLSGANTYTGGTQIDGDLTLTAKTAAGTGEISFNSGTLTIAAPADIPANRIGNFITGDSIDLQGIGLATGARLSAGNVLTLTGGTASPVTLNLDPAQNYANDSFILQPDSTTGTTVTVTQTHFYAATEADLDAILTGIDAGGINVAPKTAYTITLTAGFTLSADPDAINLGSGDSLTIDGAGQVINGGGHYRGFFVYAGTVRLQNLTLLNTAAIGGIGGSGAIPGGGGAGLGGGLFVATGASVTVSNVSFQGDSAIGGNAGSAGGSGTGGGGGLGGNGGNSGNGRSGGGGGVGSTAIGGTYGNGNGGPGILIGTTAASNGTGTYSTAGFSPGAGGPNGGGGGLAGTFSGGGGRGGGRSSPGTAGAGGVASNASFGGGAGSGQLAGFGGGGAAPNGAVNGSPNPASGTGGWGGGGSGAPGGFGGGSGVGGAGGGLGAGGAIFVQQGGTLILGAGTLSGDTVAGGSGTGGANGSAYGSAIDFQGSNQLALAPAAGQTLTIAGVIADQRSELATAGATTLVMIGAGTVILAATNPFTGGTIIKSGTVSLQAQGALGTGPISFDYGAIATLIIGSGDVPTNTIRFFLPGQTIDLQGIGTATSAVLGTGDVLAVTGGTTSVNLNLYTGQIFTGETFAVASDLHGGTLLTAVTTANDHSPYISGGAGSGNDQTPFAPLAKVVVRDLDTTQTETATLTLSSTLNGTLSNLGTGSYNAQTGVYTVSGSTAAVNTAIQGLVFTPTAHEAAPGRNVWTTFNLSVTDGIMTADTPFNVYVTALNDPPVITGLNTEQEAYWNVPFKAFAGTTISDPDFGARETVTIGLAPSAGTLALSLAGFTLTHTAAGVYTLTGNTPANDTPAAISSALDAISFTPLPNTAVPGYTITDIGLSVSDGIAPPVSASTQILAGLPIFSGVNPSQTVTDGSTIAPFSTVQITDSAGLTIQGLTIVLYDQNNLYTPTDANGTLSGAGLSQVGVGIYTLAPGTTAAVSAELDALTFTPAVASTATTGFILEAFDGATTADNYATTVTAAPPPAAAATHALAATISPSADPSLTAPIGFLPPAATLAQSPPPPAIHAVFNPVLQTALPPLSSAIAATTSLTDPWLTAPLSGGHRIGAGAWQAAVAPHLPLPLHA